MSSYIAVDTEDPLEQDALSTRIEHKPNSYRCATSRFLLVFVSIAALALVVTFGRTQLSGLLRDRDKDAPAEVPGPADGGLQSMPADDGREGVSGSGNGSQSASKDGNGVNASPKPKSILDYAEDAPGDDGREGVSGGGNGSQSASKDGNGVSASPKPNGSIDYAEDAPGDGGREGVSGSGNGSQSTSKDGNDIDASPKPKSVLDKAEDAPGDGGREGVSGSGNGSQNASKRGNDVNASPKPSKSIPDNAEDAPGDGGREGVSGSGNGSQSVSKDGSDVNASPKPKSILDYAEDAPEAFVDKTATYGYLKSGLDANGKPDVYFEHEAPPVFYRNKVGGTKCVIMSCSRVGYEYLEDSLTTNNAEKCDRVHFQVRVYLNNGKETAPHWCRLALLRQADKLFKDYERLFYTDVDVLYSEEGMLKAEAGENEFGELIMSFKYSRRDTVLRDSWFVVTNVHSEKMARLFQMWANWYKTSDKAVFLDQEVFNELFRCKDVTCVPSKGIEQKHCGGWLKGKDRVNCIQGK